ncbi:hypothetical protein QBC44DRAFT_369895 [Cladorrhinum sp. PSN332]|nr:hypothetical protein QBC44DRAFT_369895 [Cladorrhinum sp. PSN332]
MSSTPCQQVALSYIYITSSILKTCTPRECTSRLSPTTPSRSHHHQHQLRSFLQQNPAAKDSTLYTRIPNLNTASHVDPDSRIHFYETKAQDAINQFTLAFNK